MFDMANLERRHHRLASWTVFASRLVGNLVMAIAIVGLVLAGGMWGYAHFEGMSTIDAFLNAAMILSGMGPVATLTTTGGKIFAGCYALTSGLVVVAATGLVLAPIFHRMLHVFHCEDAG